MSFLKFTSVACVALTLGACASVFQTNYRAPLETKREAFEHIKPGCDNQDCPLVNIDVVHFPDEPGLDAAIDKRLREMTVNTPDARVPATLKAYEDQFMREAQPRYSSYLQAKVREQHDGIVVVELSSYVMTGGAHGMPGRGFINWSRREHRELTLKDMLVPGQERAFWQAAEEAHRGWLIASKLDKDADFIRQWPFQQTPNIALTYGGVVLKYNVYSIAPYAMGHPEVKIAYPRLNGVIKPELFPGRG